MKQRFFLHLVLLSVLLLAACSSSSSADEDSDSSSSIIELSSSEESSSSSIESSSGSSSSAGEESSSSSIESSSGSSSSTGEETSSSSIESSSSSSSENAPQSSSSNTFTDSRDKKTYKYVTIGTQIWMAENLNYNATGSKCYANSDNNCETYGRLYDWATAKDACPSGWHLPSDEEWQTLISSVGSSSGNKLKATSGWNENGNGTDKHGFSALPGGYFSKTSSEFYLRGDRSYWWSSTESDASKALGRVITTKDPVLNLVAGSDKNLFYSVRCLNNNSSSEPPASSSSSSPVKGTFTDTRNNQTYEYVTIGNQTWMAENLNYNAIGSKCHNDSLSNCAIIYGRLYNWATALQLNDTCNTTNCSKQIQSPHQGVCPSGWHLPSDMEWQTLVDFEEKATKLKATSGWNGNGNGTDKHGFSALPGGQIINNESIDIGYRGFWWIAAEEGAAYAYRRLIQYGSEVVGRVAWRKKDWQSVRCIRD